MARQYQNYLEKIVQAVELGELISFAGMVGTGEDYLYWAVGQVLPNLVKARVVQVEMHKGDMTEWEGELSAELGTKSPAGLREGVEKILDGQTVTILVYVGYGVVPSQEMVSWLLKLRDKWGTKLCVAVFGSVGMLRTDQCAIEWSKLCQSHLYILRPLDSNDQEFVLASYEERYGKNVNNETREWILMMCGGHPGIMKGLCQYVLEQGIKEGYLQASQVEWRLEKLVEELSPDQQQALRAVVKGAKSTSWLDQYGYVRDGKIFAPIVEEYLQAKIGRDPVENQLKIALTESEYRIYQHLAGGLGKIIDREEIAKVLWGDLWEQKYSDWGLDRLMSDLRKKLRDMEIDWQIRTKRGKGYIMARENNG